MVCVCVVFCGHTEARPVVTQHNESTINWTSSTMSAPGVYGPLILTPTARTPLLSDSRKSAFNAAIVALGRAWRSIQSTGGAAELMTPVNIVQETRFADGSVHLVAQQSFMTRERRGGVALVVHLDAAVRPSLRVGFSTLADGRIESLSDASVRWVLSPMSLDEKKSLLGVKVVEVKARMVGITKAVTQITFESSDRALIETLSRPIAVLIQFPNAEEAAK
jgi:hypothetical protein